MSVEMVWATPPERVRKGYPRTAGVQERVEQLRLNAGSWAIIRDASRNGAGSALKELRRMYPDIEFTSRKNVETGRQDIYGRKPV